MAEAAISYACPNCGAPVTADATKCGSCSANFDGPGGWRPRATGGSNEVPVGTWYAVSVTLGFSFLLATVFPVGNYLVQVAGGIYGASFRNVSPVLYSLVALSLNYLVMAAVIGWFLRKSGVIQRIPRQYRSARLFGLGTLLLILYLAARVMASAVAGGGAGYVVASFSMFFVWPALLMLIIAAARFFVGVGRGEANPAFEQTTPGI